MLLHRLLARFGALAVLVTPLLGAACSSNPDNSNAWNQFATAYCQRAQACFTGTEDGGTASTGASFAATYPGGVSQCVQANPLPAEYGGTISTCTQTQATACVNDTLALPCSSLSLGSKIVLAPSCAAC